MSDINSHDSGLTAYNKDGLELYIHDDGSVYASKKALQRMLDVPITTLGDALEGVGIEPPLHTQLPTSKGLQWGRLHGVDTIVAMARKFNPQLSDRMTKMGAYVFLYQSVGHKVGIQSTPVPQPSLDYSSAESLMKLAQGAMDYAKVKLAAEQHPGDKRQLEATLATDGLTLEGRSTIRQWATKHGLVLDGKQVRSIAMILSGAVKSRTEIGDIPKIKEESHDKSGRKQYSLVNYYPASMETNFLSACAALGLI